MARLVVVEGDLEAREYPIDPGVTLGREKHNSIPMPTNRKASRDHAKVWREGPKSYAVADLGSTNGTLVNDAPVTRAALKDGDLVRVGEVLFRFELDEDEKPKAKAAPERPDLAALLRGEATARPAAPTGGGPDLSGTIEVKQRVLQYNKKSLSGSPTRLDVSQTAGLQRWVILLVVAAAAVGLFLLVKNLVLSTRSDGGEVPVEGPETPGD
jgi:pSer/pThr/pTyr-binding forkhead associated (FHA) protein